MTSQTKEKFILDATAGLRMMWENREHPNCIYVDERAEVKPDIIADYQKLDMIPDSSMRLIVFDPPHRTQPHPNPRFMKKYGCQLQPETWVSEITNAFKELWRILQDWGVLIFKWTDHDIKVKHVKQCFPTKPLFHQITSGQGGKRKNATRTVWFCFMKIPEGSK